MGRIYIKPEEIVFYNNKEYKIKKVISFNQVEIKNLETNDIEHVSINNLSKKPDSKEKVYLDNYSEQEWSEALRRYEIIKDLVFVKRTKQEVETVGKKYGYSYVTLYEWIKIYEQTQDKSSLVPNTSNRGKKGSRLDPKVDKVIDEVLEDLFLNKQKYSFRRIYNKIYTACKHLKLEPPHENTVRNRIDKLDEKTVVKKRYGYKKAQEQFKNYDGEFPEGNYPLEFVQIDHTPLDIIVVDSIHREPIGRPYLTLAIDVYSRMIVGMYLSLQEPGYFNVSQCLFSIFTQKDNLLRKYGINTDWNIFGVPRIIGVDNGSDLVSSDMQRVCDEYGITLMKRPVARPQFGAHVERVLGTINSEVHNLPGTTKSNIFEKGDYKSDKEAMYNLEELTKWLINYIVKIYHKEYHSGILTTPEKKYMKGIMGDDENPGIGFLPPIIDNLEEVKISLLPTEFRTIQKDGISLDGITYYSDVLRHWIGKKDSKGKAITHKIKRDPLNIQRIYFYDSELKEYFEIPYRRLYAPVMTLWDLYAVKQHFKNQKINNYNENDIFEAYEQLSQLENDVKERHTSFHKRKKSKKSIKRNELKKTLEEVKELSSSSHFDNLFNDIEIYDVTTEGKENE
ncbi:DDE-type integrase/transposase/recombinase [Aliarcobacter cryaerophilus]|uniref:Mu transposase C-terminal domain-containing protein n=1 Tax=Aliarcobacter cryaerophilus TaxID=28198 RepID=UPI003DA3D03B